MIIIMTGLFKNLWVLTKLKQIKKMKFVGVYKNLVFTLTLIFLSIISLQGLKQCENTISRFQIKSDHNIIAKKELDFSKFVGGKSVDVISELTFFSK